VDSKARIAEDVAIGPYSIIQGDVEIDKGTHIHSHVLIADGARIGKNCQVHHGSAISTLPQDLKFAGEETTLEIEDNTIIREFCDLNRGTQHRGKSKIGKNCFLMAYTHVAHDCFLGDKVILANGVQLAGHVTIEDWVTVGGLVPVHQFCMIGKHSFIGGGFRVVQDIPPYILAAGEPLAFKGLNIIGLKRREFSQETISQLRKCYRLLYQAKLNTSQALVRIRAEVNIGAEVQIVLDFIEKSERGIIR
jgi:UDP-N-acetylglucosamine acyltransferase